LAFRIDRFVIVFNGFDDVQPIVDYRQRDGTAGFCSLDRSANSS